MTRVTVKVEGLRELDRRLSKLNRELAADALEEAALDAMRPVLADVNRNTPVGRNTMDPGNLKRHNKIQVWEKSHAFVDVEIINTANHAHLVELGHRLVKGGKLGDGGRVIGHVRPHPFLRPAFDGNVRRVLNDFKRGLGRVIERAERA